MADLWLLNHPGQKITFFDVASIFGQAFVKSATVSIGMKGFEACGIWPCNPSNFSDADFAAAQLTDEPTSKNNTQMLPSTSGQSYNSLIADDATMPSTSTQDCNTRVSNHAPMPSTSTQGCNIQVSNQTPVLLNHVPSCSPQVTGHAIMQL